MFFHFIMDILVELGTVFWVGAQLWLNFVLPLSTEAHREERLVNEEVQHYFERRFSLPTLLLLLLATTGVWMGQALKLSDGKWQAVSHLPLLESLLTSASSGTYWLAREIIIALALLLSLYTFWCGTRARLANVLLSLANLILGSTLFIAMTLSSQELTDSTNLIGSALVMDWLHLLGAALWIGSIFFMAIIYLPVIRYRPVVEQARSLITILAYASPLTVTGIVLVALTGPSSAIFQLGSLAQLLLTDYGRTLLLKILLVGALLFTCAIRLAMIHPYLSNEYKKYRYAVERLQATQIEKTAQENRHRGGLDEQRSARTTIESGSNMTCFARRVGLREKRLAKGTARLISLLRWEPVFGVAVLVCVGLMNVLANVSPGAPALLPQPTTRQPQFFAAAVNTTDGRFAVTLRVNPNRVGPNVFTISVRDIGKGKPAASLEVSLDTTMLDMYMGTHTINASHDGNGQFKATVDLSMAGNWQIGIQIRLPDATLHAASIELYTPL